MKETTVYRSEFLVVECPYCGKKHYMDVEDDIGDGNIPDNGRKFRCEGCKEDFVVVPEW